MWLHRPNDHPKGQIISAVEHLWCEWGWNNKPQSILHCHSVWFRSVHRPKWRRLRESNEGKEVDLIKVILYIYIYIMKVTEQSSLSLCTSMPTRISSFSYFVVLVFSVASHPRSISTFFISMWVWLSFLCVLRLVMLGHFLCGFSILILDLLYRDPLASARTSPLATTLHPSAHTCTWVPYHHWEQICCHMQLNSGEPQSNQYHPCTSSPCGDFYAYTWGYS